MDPVSLRRPDFDSFAVPSSPEGPTVYLTNLPADLEIPLEGEIRFRYSRQDLTISVNERGAHKQVTLCLKKITDVCDCEGKGEEEDDGPELPRKAKDADEVLTQLLDELSEDYIDESEDDNPDKY
jgi:hypothetical protein